MYRKQKGTGSTEKQDAAHGLPKTQKPGEHGRAHSPSWGSVASGTRPAEPDKNQAGGPARPEGLCGHLKVTPKATEGTGREPSTPNHAGLLSHTWKGPAGQETAGLLAHLPAADGREGAGPQASFHEPRDPVFGPPSSRRGQSRGINSATGSRQSPILSSGPAPPRLVSPRKPAAAQTHGQTILTVPLRGEPWGPGGSRGCDRSTPRPPMNIHTGPPDGEDADPHTTCAQALDSRLSWPAPCAEQTPGGLTAAPRWREHMAWARSRTSTHRTGLTDQDELHRRRGPAGGASG